MTAAWVAATVRGKALARRCLGSTAIQNLSSLRGRQAAVEYLASTSYGSGFDSGTDLATAERSISDTACWHLRILAGWAPASGAAFIQPLTLWFEVCNIEELAVSYNDPHGHTPPPAYNLGRLAMAWPRVRNSSNLTDLKTALGTTVLGEPEAGTLPSILLGVRLGFARVLASRCPDASWGSGLAALELAKSRLLGSESPPMHHTGSTIIGHAWRTAPDVRSFADAVPARARWVLEGIDHPNELWRAEIGWWRRLARDGARLMSRGTFAQGPVLGAGLVILADARLAQLALASAAGALDREGRDAAA